MIAECCSWEVGVLFVGALVSLVFKNSKDPVRKVTKIMERSDP